jgi:hypothetical protein
VEKKSKRKIPPYGWNETEFTKTMNFRLPRTIINKMEMFSAEHFVTKTSIVVQALEEYLQ